jgi:putative DNA primase/helicase
MAETKKAFHEQVAEQLIEQLKQGTAPWQRPWHPGEPGSFIPINPTTGKRYRGINAIQLLGQGRTDQRWMTYKQAAAAGAQVRKGEKGTPIQYWKFSEEQAKTDEAGKPVLDAQGQPVKDDVRLERPRVFFATVFNAEQIDGLPPLQPRKEQEWNALERVEHILHASGALIQHGPQNRAFYRPGSDSIHLPEKGQFPSADTYYATALHELGHWTGHPSRLARDLEHPFGSEAYAKEELRAEIASMIMGDELGIGHDPGQHAAYVGTWIKVLKDDPLEVFRAAADAEKIHAYVLALEQKQVQEQSTEQSQAAIAPVISDSENQEAAMQTLTQSEANAHEQAAELARLEEERVRKDPDSTDEQITAAREARKSADLAVVLNDADIQRRVAQIESEKPPAPTVNDADQAKKTYLDVPYHQKDEAKALGARWDRQEQSWFLPAGIKDIAPFAQWARNADTAAPERPTQPEKQGTQERQYLAVPYGERAAAKAAGALWDKAAKSWFAGAKADKSRLQRWLPENVAWPARAGDVAARRVRRGLALDRLCGERRTSHDGRQETSHQRRRREAQRESRFRLLCWPPGRSPGRLREKQQDRRRHEVEVERLCARSRAESQSYRPKRPTSCKRALPSRNACKSRRRSGWRSRWRTCCRLPHRPRTCKPRESSRRRGFSRTRKAGKPISRPPTPTASNGRCSTSRRTAPSASPRTAARKAASTQSAAWMPCPRPLPWSLAKATRRPAALQQTLGFATVAAFDSGNLLPVAKALHAKFPDKPILIAGDDDRHLEATQGINPGRSKAEEAAKAVGGKALLPIFAPGEQAARPEGLYRLQRPGDQERAGAGRD